MMRDWWLAMVLWALAGGLVVVGVLLVLTTEAEFGGFAALLLGVLLVPFAIFCAPSGAEREDRVQ